MVLVVVEETTFLAYTNSETNFNLKVPFFSPRQLFDFAQKFIHAEYTEFGGMRENGSGCIYNVEKRN
jgi:hypothetical protein